MGGISIFAVCIVDPDPMSSEEELCEDIEEPFEDPVGEGVDENESTLLI